MGDALDKVHIGYAITFPLAGGLLTQLERQTGMESWLQLCGLG